MLDAVAALVRVVDDLNDAIGRAVSWLCLTMVVITLLVVVLRYVFAIGFVWFQESYVWLHGVVFMIGAGYTLLHNGHVRVDVVYRPRSARYKAWVDLCGSLLLLLPVLILVLWVSIPYVWDSWQRLEQSREAGGLPGLFLLKTVIPVMCLLLGAQALSLAGRSLLVLCGQEEFAAGDAEENG